MNNFHNFYKSYIDIQRKATVNVETTSRCRLQCPFCQRQREGGKEKVKAAGEMSYESMRKIYNFATSINFCGQISDPIHHPKFIDFLQLLKEKNKICTIHTASSYKPLSWYIKAFKTNPNANWIFGIDGLPEESHKHRINQNGVKLFKVMLEARKYLNVKPIWQYIPFDYNKDNINEIKKIANNKGLILKELVARKDLSTGGYIEHFKT